MATGFPCFAGVIISVAGVILLTQPWYDKSTLQPVSLNPSCSLFRQVSLLVLRLTCSPTMAHQPTGYDLATKIATKLYLGCGVVWHTKIVTKTYLGILLTEGMHAQEI